MSLSSAEIRVAFAARTSGTNSLQAPTWGPAIDTLLTFAAGTGADQCDLIWGASKTLAASTTEDLDLAGGLTDEYGATITMAEVVAVAIWADDANTNAFVLGGAASNAVPLFSDVSDRLPVQPGGVALIAAPKAAGQCTVTAGTGDKLRIGNGGAGTPVTARIVILGRSA